MTLRVKDTYLSAVIHGDIGMHRAKSLLQGDVLGQIIVVGEGNQGRDEDGDGDREPGRSSGDYTHCFFVTQPPDPEAEVEVVRTDKVTGRKIYKVKDKKKSGLKCHSTWPCVIEEHIDWDSDYFELWRVREISRRYWAANKTIPPEVWRIVKWARDKRGKIYNWLQFLTFGLIHIPNSWVCSHFIFDGCYESTQFMDEPIIVSPDGVFDQLVTPNDLINSGKMIRIRYDGAMKKAIV
jgi:hypothetical protein